MKRKSSSPKKNKALRRKRGTWQGFNAPKVVVHQGRIGFLPTPFQAPQEAILDQPPADLADRVQIQLSPGLVLVGKKKNPDSIKDIAK